MGNGLDRAAARQRRLAAFQAGDRARRDGLADGLQQLASEIEAGEHGEGGLMLAGRLLAVRRAGGETWHGLLCVCATCTDPAAAAAADRAAYTP